MAGLAAALLIGIAGGGETAAFLGLVVVGTLVLLLLNEKDEGTGSE